MLQIQLFHFEEVFQIVFRIVLIRLNIYIAITFSSIIIIVVLGRCKWHQYVLLWASEIILVSDISTSYYRLLKSYLYFCFDELMRFIDVCVSNVGTNR